MSTHPEERPIHLPTGKVTSGIRHVSDDVDPEDAAKGKALSGPTAGLAADDELMQWGVDPSRTDGEGNPVEPGFDTDRSTFHETPLDGDSRPVVPRDTRPLNDIMEFDHVVEVLPDGSVVDHSGVWAPVLYEDNEGNWELEGSDKWELLDGHSGQQDYSGPLMHQSEFIGGGMEQRIREEPGVYVAVYALPMDPDQEHEPYEWAVARLKGDTGADPLMKAALSTVKPRSFDGMDLRNGVRVSAQMPSEGPSVPADREGRMEYRRTATTFATARCDALDDPNSEDYDPNAREILTMRFGGGGKPPADLGQLADRLGTSRSDIRQREVKALRKVMNSDPELAKMYEQGWDKVGYGQRNEP